MFFSAVSASLREIFLCLSSRLCYRRVAEIVMGVHTRTMTLKNAALLALLGTLLLTIELVANWILNVSGFLRDLTPAIAFLSSTVRMLAGLSALVFFYVFHKAQS